MGREVTMPLWGILILIYWALHGIVDSFERSMLVAAFMRGWNGN